MAGQPTPMAAEILDELRAYGIAWNEERLQQALRVVDDVYEGQMHWSGETVLQHCLGVLRILLPFQPDEDAIIACLLHHVLQSTDWTLIDLEREFGPRVRALVSGVHLLSHVTVRGRRISVQDLRLMMLTVSDDIRTLLISLCDRSYLLQQVEHLQPEEQRKLCQDALNLFAPVAARLGIYSLKHELENLAFPVLYPHDAERIAEQSKRLSAQYGSFLDTAGGHLQDRLREEGLPAQVFAREKQPYSIFQKMRQKSLTAIESIYDLYALRVVVDSVEECYRVLGILHKLGRPVGHRFKDFISFPKPNGYQSLHTTLLQLEDCPENVFVEVQVRTRDMHRKAQYGIAAHWSYKEQGSTHRAMEQVQLHQVLASQEMREDDGESRLVDHIYVLTPRGDVVELPEGATPLDFAFQVHTDLGLSFRGARINGVMAPIDYELENGDVVEILKQKTPHPSPQWFQLLRLSSARSKLKRYLYAQQRPELITEGRRLVNEQLKSRNLPLLDQDLSLLRKCDGKVLTLQQREDVLMKIGQGAEKVGSLLDRLDDLRPAPQARSKNRQTTAPASASEIAVALEGDVPMPTQFAFCCKPHDRAHGQIVGVVHRTGKVMIHRHDCGMLKHSNPARRIGARWARRPAPAPSQPSAAA